MSVQENCDQSHLKEVTSSSGGQGDWIVCQRGALRAASPKLNKREDLLLDGLNDHLPT